MDLASVLESRTASPRVYQWVSLPPFKFFERLRFKMALLHLVGGVRKGILLDMIVDFLFAASSGNWRTIQKLFKNMNPPQNYFTGELNAVLDNLLGLYQNFKGLISSFLFLHSNKMTDRVATIKR